MISVSLVLATLAFVVCFVVLRKKNLSVRILSGVVLALVLVGLFLTLIIIGGDTAQPDAINYTNRK